MQNIAFLGLGIMGAGMAGRLVQAGFNVTVWNRDARKAEPLAAAGAQVAATPAEAVSNADVVVAMLSQDDASRQVWLGDDGAIAAMKPGAVAIEASTLTHAWVKELAAAAEARGIGFLDAPVTGSKQQANEGSLRFLVGGDAQALERAKPAFEAMGQVVEHLGPVGSGALVKLANNYLCGVQVASLAEAVALLENHGLDMEQAMGVILSGAPASPMVKLITRRMLDRTYDPQFFITLMAKDMDYSGQLLADIGIPSDLASAARRRFLDAASAGFEDKDLSSVVEPLRNRR